MKISKKIIITVTVALFIVSCYAFTFEALTPIQPATPAEPQNTDTETNVYIVKEYNGKIAVFLSNSTAPLYVLDDPYVRDLPEYDREMLKNGIIANNNSELIKILEDYDY